jgi:hypothetical protein
MQRLEKIEIPKNKLDNAMVIPNEYLKAIKKLREKESTVLLWIIEKFQLCGYLKIYEEFYLDELIYYLEIDTELNRRLIKSALKNLEEKKLILTEKLPNKKIIFSLNLELIAIEEETGRP